MKLNSIQKKWPLVGNDHIFEFLVKSLANKNIAGSYIFSGPDGIGKNKAANYFAKSLVCSAKDRTGGPCDQCQACLQAEKGLHGDIYLIEKSLDKKNISLEQVRDFIRSLSLSSFLNSYKIGIIKDAQYLSIGAFNALLKTLEEPKNKVVIILTAPDFDALPKTIISRSQILRFRPVASDLIYNDLIKNHQAQRSQAKNFSRLAAGRPAMAVKFFEEKEYYLDYENQVKAYFDFIKPDINESFKAIEKILGDSAAGAESAKTAIKIINIWLNLTRDLLLLGFGLGDLIQHEVFSDELEEMKNKLSLKARLNLVNALKQAKEYIGANVNPKMALEYAAVNM